MPTLLKRKVTPITSFFKRIQHLILFKCLLAIVALVSVQIPGYAQGPSFSLAPLFADHMVIQRQMPLTISGSAPMHQRVNVVFKGNTYVTEADKTGEWSIQVPAQTAGGPYDIRATSDGNEIVVSDVYFGDVWLASGQSNMEWKLEWKVDNWQAEIDDSNYPLVRYFGVKNKYAPMPQQRVTGEWKRASPKDAGEFSAVAWFFAKRLHLDTKVPVGIIDATWGGTPAEAWTPLEDLLGIKEYKEKANAYLEEPQKWLPIFENSRLEHIIQAEKLNSTVGHSEMSYASLTFDDSAWTKTSLPMGDVLNNIVWARKTFTLKSIPSEASLNIGWLPPQAQIYLNNQMLKQKKGSDKNEPITIAASMFKTGENVLAIRALSTWDNRVNIGTKGKLFLQTNTQKLMLNKGWRINNTLEGELPMPKRYWQQTGTLYNAMIHPLIHFPIKGVIWYQGESNVRKANVYKTLFSTMIESWRERWQQPDMPFIFAQLASMHPQQKKPMESQWAELREAQTQTLSLPNTAMAVLIDAGDAYDIHPRNKQIVGERLYAAAQATVYGKAIVYQGPMVDAVKVNKGKLLISYQDLGSGLIVDGNSLLGFEVAGSDGVYHTADAAINGDYVVVGSKKVRKPKHVRYAWANNSPANLYNREGFPAVPFRRGR